MAQSKDDIKYGTSQSRLNEDEAVRIAYKHGTPLEGGKIAESEPVDLFPGAHQISMRTEPPHGHDDPIRQQDDSNNQSQMRRDPADDIQAGQESYTNSAS